MPEIVEKSTEVSQNPLAFEPDILAFCCEH